MAGKFTTRPMRIAKHKWRAPRWSSSLGHRQTQSRETLDLEERLVGDEKHGYTDDEADEEHEDRTISATSSRATSYSNEGLLAPSSPPKRPASAYAGKLRARKCNRYFTLALTLSLILFLLTLIKLGYSSRKNVAEAFAQANPPKPAPWEEFPFLKRYVGGIRTLVSRAQNVPEYPGNDEDIIETLRNVTNRQDIETASILARQEENTAQIQDHNLPSSSPFDPFPNRPLSFPPIIDCFLDNKSTTRIPKLHTFPGVVSGMPDNVHGSYELLRLNGDVCFDRFGRLGPYGLGYSRKMGGTGAGMEGDVEGIERIWSKDPEVDFRTIKWVNVQEVCADRNKHRFQGPEASRDRPTRSMNTRDTETDGEKSITDSVLEQAPDTPTRKAPTDQPLNSTSHKKLLPRTAVVLRAWSDYEYGPEDIMYLRALIAELSIASGTEYVVHFLIHVRDNELPIWSDDETHDRILAESLPEEFRGMGTLWSERQMSLLYTGLDESERRGGPVYGNYRSTFLPVQYFAHQHPEYDFFWHWEMDVRYIGHYYHLFDSVSTWSKEQPRKGLWERNARFYVPSEHGSWEDFKQMVRVQTEHGTSSKNNMYSRIGTSDPQHGTSKVEKPVWGPEAPEFDDVDHVNDPQPPTTYEKDKYEWGVGEDADLITFNPLFDPDQTGWGLAEDVTGYNITAGLPPRRAAIVTASRLSRRLLETMHRETALQHRTMFSEMWPASCALHHGLKAVYVPHPVFIDRRWPTDYLAAVFNGGRNGATGGARTTPFNDERHHNFLGVTWYYHAGFPANLWKRWLGYKVNNDGGEEWELANEGRMCLPAMLLHPVKQVRMVYEHREGE